MYFLIQDPAKDCLSDGVGKLTPILVNIKAETKMM